MKYYFLMAIMLASGSVQAKWFTLDRVDDFTDEAVKAVVYEDENVRLQFNPNFYDVISSGEVNTRLGMKLYVSSKRGLFEPNSSLELRVDKQELHTRVNTGLKLTPLGAFSPV